MTDAVLTEKDRHTLVGWDENFRKRVHQRKKSKCTSELHFFSLICLTCIFAGAHPKLEYKSSLVTWMSDNYILAFDHTDSFQVIWVEEKKSLGIHQTFSCGSFCSMWTWTYKVMRSGHLLSPCYSMTSPKNP